MTSPKHTSNPNAHIIEYLKYYLGLYESPEFAVMLSGGWGIGKTYLIENFFESQEKEEDVKHIYVSLYGLSSIEQLADILLFQRLPKVDAKKAKLIGNIGNMAKNFSRLTKGLKISDFFEIDPSKIYVFDDLERSEMEIQEVLGFINQMVEHGKCKVIISANEKEIKDKKYRKIKEKLIGKTLVVKSSLDGALRHFIEEIPCTKTKAFYENNQSEISEVYQCSKIENLRILKQSLSDFARLFSSLTKKQLKAEEATLLLFQQFLAYSFDFKTGKIGEKDLKKTTNSFNYWARRNDGKKLSPIEKTLKKYRNTIRIDETILSPEILVETISQGLFDESRISSYINEHPFFQKKEKEEAWVTLWRKWQRDDDEFETALKEVNNQFKKRKFLDIGIILHVFGLKIWLAKNGFESTCVKDVLASCKTYIDDLLSQRKLAPLPIDPFDDPENHGLSFHEQGTDEFNELYSYVQDKRKEAEEAEYEEKAITLLEEMKKDVGLFRRRINAETDDSRYYNAPIFKVIAPSQFVEDVLSLHADDRWAVFNALRKRHEHRPPTRQLHDEIEWLKDVKSVLSSKTSTTPRLLTFQIEKSYIAHIDEILKQHNPDTSDG